MAKSSFVPQYQVIYDNLKAKIQSGELAPGSRLPFERELCEAFGVQRITVRKALDMLVQDGLIYKRAGCGSFVNAPHRESEPAQQGTLLFVMNKSQNDIRSNSSAYNAQLFFLMEQMCRQSGYTLLYAGVSSAREIDALAEQYPIAGAFLVSTLDAEIVERHLALGTPLLCLNHHEARILSVLPDNEAGIAQAVSRLAALGHRRIAFVGGAPQSCNAMERLHGFVSAMHDCGLAVEPALLVQGDWTYDGSLKAVQTMLSALAREAWPSALVAASDMMALGAIEAANRLGLKVPGELSVVGFDNIDLCRFCSPQLTSVGPRAEQMAHVAVEHMLAMLQRGGMAAWDRYTVRIPVEWMERASIAPPAQT